jgi:hypothetical protein
VPLEHEKRKQSARLQATQLAGALPTVEQNSDLSAELNPVPADHAIDCRPHSPIPPWKSRRRSQCLPRWELTPGHEPDHHMRVRVHLRGESESALIVRAREHLQANHPAIASDASDADLLDMAAIEDRSDPA